MKRFTSLLIGCSLALAGVALAQQPEESPGKKKKQGTEQTQPAQAKPGATAAKPHATAVREHGARNEPGTMNEPAATKGRKGQPKSETSAQTGTNVSGQPASSATPSAEQPKKGMKGRAATKASPAATAAAAARATPGAAASAAPSVSATGQQRGQANAAAAKKPAPQ